MLDASVNFTWKAIAAGKDGPARSRHCLAYDPGSKALLLHGGIDWNRGGALLGDSWQFRDRQWSRVDAREQPPARHRGAMVHDPDRGFSILFGGQGKGWIGWPLLADTWAFAGGRWIRRASSRFDPQARCGHAFAFDEGAGVAVLFGGIDRYGNSLRDTWLFDGTAWRRVPGRSPPARRYAALAYDPDLKGCVLHGGSQDEVGRLSFGDTWLFRNLSWQRMGLAFETDVCDDHSLAYHRVARCLTMSGGLGRPHGILRRAADGWRPCAAAPWPPRYQCSPLVWSDDLHGLVMHGGESRHAGPQFDTTWVLECLGSQTD